MRIKNAIKGTPLEMPARKFVNTFSRRKHITQASRPPHSASTLRILASATYPHRQAIDPSILFFTTHKCASTFINKLLPQVAESSPYQHMNYEGAIYRLGNEVSLGNPYDPLSNLPQDLFFSHGEIYGPLRVPVKLKEEEAFRKIFFLRDPRDVLVSAYYSFGFSHGIPKNVKNQQIFMERRERIQKEGIDCYAIRDAAEWLLPVYCEYDRIRQESWECLYIKYDDYLADTAGTIRSIFEFCKAPVSESVVAALVEDASPVQEQPKNGDKPLRHRRSGQSGQFRSELAPETVLELDRILKEPLKKWNFTD